MKKRILSLILCLILVVSTLLAQIAFFISNAVYNRNLYEDVLKKYNISDEIYNNYVDKLTMFTRSRNLPESVFKDVITKETISDCSSKNIIYGIDFMRGKADASYQNDPKEYVDKIMKNVNDYINTLDATHEQDPEALNAELENIALGYENRINTYINEVSLGLITLVNPNNIPQIKIVDTISNLRFVFLLVSLLLAVGIFFINKKNIIKFFNYVGYSIFISGIFTFSPGLTGTVSKFYTKLPMVKEYTNKLVTGVLDSYFKFFFISGLILLILGLVFIIVGFVLDIKKSKVATS